ncbi:MAG: AbrB/MazE/SpoVT family DNA-binding domain-containing protein [candidate division Zixibacteria bacterium]|nr:AbrB/MazE/SpoVT family DNA-binding domain-containing protein [candidate division Zixibacteria bacterium]
MTKQKKDENCCGSDQKNTGCCGVEAVVTVDERGQMVLPKELREKAKIKAGDKLAIISFEKDGDVCCFSLIKADQFGGMVKDFLGPMMKDIVD